MITLSCNKKFTKTRNFFERILETMNLSTYDQYGKKGVKLLAEATPKRTGVTAGSWSYEIVRKDGVVSIEWHNSNVHDGAVIAILLQYGHATRNGGWIEGTDYVNPAIQQAFESLATEIWREVKSA